MEKLTRSQVKYMVARARSEKRPVLFKDVDLSGAVKRLVEIMAENHGGSD